MEMWNEGHCLSAKNEPCSQSSVPLGKASAVGVADQHIRTAVAEPIHYSDGI